MSCVLRMMGSLWLSDLHILRGDLGLMGEEDSEKEPFSQIESSLRKDTVRTTNPIAELMEAFEDPCRFISGRLIG